MHTRSIDPKNRPPPLSYLQISNADASLFALLQIINTVIHCHLFTNTVIL
jgi:hypothetical protein